LHQYERERERERERENERPQRAKAVMGKKNTALDLKTYFKAVVTKTAWYWHKI
jgi:hypothetical protein